MMPGITAAVRPPRALAVPYGLGYPLGRPGDADLHRAILLRLLALCTRTDVPVVATLPAGQADWPEG